MSASRIQQHTRRRDPIRVFGAGPEPLGYIRPPAPYCVVRITIFDGSTEHETEIVNHHPRLVAADVLAVLRGEEPPSMLPQPDPLEVALRAKAAEIGCTEYELGAIVDDARQEQRMGRAEVLAFIERIKR